MVSSGNSSDAELNQIAEEARQTDAVIDEIAESPLDQGASNLSNKIMGEIAESPTRSFPGTEGRLRDDGDGVSESEVRLGIVENKNLFLELGAVRSEQNLRHMDSLVDALESTHF